MLAYILLRYILGIFLRCDVFLVILFSTFKTRQPFLTCAGKIGQENRNSGENGSSGLNKPTPSSKTTPSPTGLRWDHPMWEAWSAAHPSVPTLFLSGLSYSSLMTGGMGASGAPVTGDVNSKSFVCPRCGRGYKLKSSLRNHEKWECGKEPQFMCPYCNYRAKQKMHVARHIERMHKAKIEVP